jgi:hypothetical protein
MDSYRKPRDLFKYAADNPNAFVFWIEVQSYQGRTGTSVALTAARAFAWVPPASFAGFEIRSNRNSNVVVIIPYWFLVLSLGVIAAAPWIRWRRFSLRTLLIGMTLIAVGLGLLAWLGK